MKKLANTPTTEALLIGAVLFALAKILRTLFILDIDSNSYSDTLLIFDFLSLVGVILFFIGFLSLAAKVSILYKEYEKDNKVN